MLIYRQTFGAFGDYAMEPGDTRELIYDSTEQAWVFIGYS